jgi:GR25 family glycosyltransferase involved in LPS biosynthesis
MNQPDPWKFFEAIYCISVADRLDRREQVQKQFAAVGLRERVEFVLVARHPENRERGIFESHMLCLEKGLAAGAHHILIFEDDVFFRDFAPRTLAEACLQLDRLARWDGLFLGGITSGSRRTGVKSLVRINYRCLSHAYALNAPYARRIVREQWRGIPYDGLLRENSGDLFAIYPMSAFQGLFESDNQTVAIDRMRRLFGGLPFIQKMNEIYQNHKALVLAVHLAVFLVLGTLVYTLW